MKWLKDLYVSPAMEKKKIRVKWKLEHGAGVVGTFLLVLPMDDSTNQLEIINSVYLKQKYYKRKNMVIIGMAESVDSAYDILIKITGETYENTGDANIKEYLLAKHRFKSSHN